MFQAARIFNNAIAIRWRLIASCEKAFDYWQRNDYLQGTKFQLFGQMRHYSKIRASGKISKKRGQEMKKPVGTPETREIDMDLAENVQDWISENISKQDVFNGIESEHKNHQKWLVHRILQRKYFKPPQETNVLTWAAKEQIRYLNAEYPEEWTPEKLANSFSLTVSGVQRLLRSTFVPRNQEEIVDHDRRALAKLEKLGIRRNTAQLQLAVGSEKLPMAPAKQIPDGGKDVKVSPGIFVSLLPNKVQPNSNKVLRELNLKSLASEAGCRESVIKTNMADKSTAHRKSEEFHRKDPVEILSSLDNNRANDNVDRSERCINVAGNSRSYDVLDSQTGTNRSLRRRLRNTDAAASSTTNSSFDREEYAMKGTKKLLINNKTKHEDVEEKARQNAHLMRARPSKSLEGPDKRHSPDVRFDEDLYIYDEHKGYQYPYGRQMDLPIDKLAVDKQRFKTKQAKSRPGLSLHKQGNDFFDDDGEFLFRVP